MIDFTTIRAIDFHTHAEEPCGCHADDGFVDLQSAMATYFGAPLTHPPTIPEATARFRKKNIAVMIFPVDAEREKGFGRYNSMPLKYSNPMHSDDVAVDFADMPILIRYANTILKKKMLFGSDWPMIAPEKWLDAFDKAEFRDEVRPLILKETAMHLLGITP